MTTTTTTTTITIIIIIIIIGDRLDNWLDFALLIIY